MVRKPHRDALGTIVCLLLLVGVLGIVPSHAQMEDRGGSELAAGGHQSMAGEVPWPVSGGNLLYDNGPYVTDIGAGCDGFDASSFQGADNTFGWNTLIDTFRLADDFTVSAGETWSLDELLWRIYQTNSDPTDPISVADVWIYDGDPSLGGNVIAGRLGAPTNASGFAGVYRDSGDAGCARAVKDVLIDMAWAPALAAGTYWVELSTSGVGAFSGPWAPPTTPGDPATDNGLSFDVNLGVYTRLEDSGSLDPQDFPFQLFGSTGGNTGPNLAIGGSCPGAGSIDITDGTPGATVAILFSPAPGQAELPGGPCVGVISGLGTPNLLTTLPLDASGNASLSPSFPSVACGASMQILDASNCRVSNVEQVP